MKGDWWGAAWAGQPLLHEYRSGGKSNIYLRPSVCPPHSSSYSLIEPWPWHCVSIWLSLSVTSRCSCFPGFAKRWNLSLIYETETCIHHFSGGNTVPPLKDHSGPRECRTFAAVDGGWALNMNYTSAQIAFWKRQRKRVKYSNNSLTNV